MKSESWYARLTMRLLLSSCCLSLATEDRAATLSRQRNLRLNARSGPAQLLWQH